MYPICELFVNDKNISFDVHTHESKSILKCEITEKEVHDEVNKLKFKKKQLG